VLAVTQPFLTERFISAVISVLPSKGLGPTQQVVGAVPI
jgi:hypothetical protein